MDVPKHWLASVAIVAVITLGGFSARVSRLVLECGHLRGRALDGEDPSGSSAAAAGKGHRDRVPRHSPGPATSWTLGCRASATSTASAPP